MAGRDAATNQMEESKRKQKSVLFVTVYSLGERNGKDVGMKYKLAPIGVKEKGKETRKTPKILMIILCIHDGSWNPFI